MSILNRRRSGFTAIAFSLLLACRGFCEEGAWSTKSPLPRPRDGMAVGVADGILYAVGGTYGGVLPTDAVTAYDPKTDT